ncbi:MAG: hypothetical protein ABR540_21035 [Acidimicrobiales bacterium]
MARSNGTPGGRQLVERCLHRPDGGGDVPGGGQQAGAHGGDPGLEPGNVELAGSADEVVAGCARGSEIPHPELDVHQDR